MTETNVTYGVRIERQFKVGTEYVVCTVMKREDDAHHPLNATSRFGYGDEPYYENLTLEGYVSEVLDQQFHWLTPGYRDLFNVDTRKAERMLKMLKRIDRQADKDEAREIGDVFASFCKAVGAKWVVVETENRGTMYSDSRWHFMSLAEGKNRVRTMAATARQDAQNRFNVSQPSNIA